MRTCKIQVESLSPYSQSKCIMDPKPDGMTHADWEKESWRKRMHTTNDGHVLIPPMSFKKSLTRVARYLGQKIPGRGNKTYVDLFTAGIVVVDPVILQDLAAEVQGEWVFVPSSGKAGDGSRVWKCFPVIPSWVGEVVVHVLEDGISKEVFESHFEKAGQFIGIGRFRPERDGYYGRFKVNRFTWE